MATVHLHCVAAEIARFLFSPVLSSVLQPPSPEEKEELVNEVKGPPEPRQWIGLGSEQEIQDESVRESRKKVHWLTKSTSLFVYEIVYLHCLSHQISTTVPLLYFAFLFLWLATVHILQRAQEIWPTSPFFRPQCCRCSDWPHRLCFLPRQQIQPQAGAAGLQNSGYSQAAEQHSSDTMVLHQTLMQSFTGTDNHFKSVTVFFIFKPSRGYDEKTNTLHDIKWNENCCFCFTLFTQICTYFH